MHFTGAKSSSSHILSKDNMFMPNYKKTSKQSRTYTVRQAARYINSQPSGGSNAYHLLSIGISQNMACTGPRSAVGNVSSYRCVSDCRSRGREFDPGPVPYFRGD